MRPNTVHYVLTVDDSIVYGRHLFPIRSMQAIASGIIHTFILNYTVTNTLHESTLHTMLRRMMAMWTLNAKTQKSPKLSHFHAPDICTVAGLMDFMTLGKLLECSQVLDRRSYESGLNGQDQSEIATSRWRFRRLLAEFSCRWTLTVGDTIVSPWSVFIRLLVEFAAAIVVYKNNNASSTERTKTGLTKDTLRQKMVDLLTANYPELLPCFHRLVAEKYQFFYWTGPSISISRNQHNGMPIDFDDKPMFSLAKRDDAHSKRAAITSQMVEAAADHDVVMGDESNTKCLPRLERSSLSETHASGSGNDADMGNASNEVGTPPNEDTGPRPDTGSGSRSSTDDGSESKKGSGSGPNADTSVTGKRHRTSSGMYIYFWIFKYILLM